MGNMPLSVLVITILTLICTITYVVTMYLGLDMIPQVSIGQMHFYKYLFGEYKNCFRW